MIVVQAAGCAGLIANIIYPGHTIKAQYDGLEDQRVAVVCISGMSDYHPNSPSTLLAKGIEKLLRRNVRDIEIIDQQKIADWIDHHDWDRLDYDFTKIAEGVGADKLVAVELSGFRLHDSQTMYKGHAELSVTVYDMTDGKQQIPILDSEPSVFPANGGRSTTDCSEAQFRKSFIKLLAHRVAKNFYDYDLKEQMALDATDMGW